MKLKRFFAGLAVSAMVCAAAMTSAGAYFTANDPAAGDVIFNQDESSSMIEHVDVNEGKQLTISNTGDLNENVRARVYYPSGYAVTVDPQETDNWKDGGDGWYYYQPELEPGQDTETLNISIMLPAAAEDAGDGVNIIVVYEAKLPSEQWQTTQTEVEK